MFSYLKALIVAPPTMAVVALISLSLAVYTGFFYERHAEVRVEVTSNANVLDIRERLSKLDILYDGTSLKEKNRNLKLITLRILNSGSGSILKGMYDESEPLGFRISKGEILEAPEIRASEYLKRNLKPAFQDRSTVIFSPVILEAAESFEVKLLVLAPADEEVTIRPQGKIGGIRSFQVTEPYKTSAQRGLWDDVFAGDLLVQSVRLPIYFVGFIVALFLVIAPTAVISSALSRRRRRKRIDLYKSTLDEKPTKAEERIFSAYINDEGWVLGEIENLLEPEGSQGKKRGRRYRRVLEDRVLHITSFDVIPEELVKVGLAIKGENETYVVNPDVRAKVSRLMKYVSAEKPTPDMADLDEMDKWGQ